MRRHRGTTADTDSLFSASKPTVYDAIRYLVPVLVVCKALSLITAWLQLPVAQIIDCNLIESELQSRHPWRDQVVVLSVVPRAEVARPNSIELDQLMLNRT